ncbi:MAG: response regulator, partial [Deltaproteobacteria bacterium]|nr:response regulator [Deltaproteobacteria bacterium]
MDDAARTAPGSCVRTLVIDDDPSIVRFLELYLGANGFAIHAALTGQEGLALAERLVPDVILLDYAMPHLAGKEVLRRLRENERTVGIPVVVLTARFGDTIKGAELGVDDYISM